MFVTTYALVLPAITLEQVAFCGIPEHQHTDACYEERLVCGIPEGEGHQHEASCYEKFLICGQEVHVHSTECYQQDSSAVVSSGSGAAASTDHGVLNGSGTYSGDSSGGDIGATVTNNGSNVLEDTEEYNSASTDDSDPAVDTSRDFAGADPKASGTGIFDKTYSDTANPQDAESQFSEVDKAAMTEENRDVVPEEGKSVPSEEKTGSRTDIANDENKILDWKPGDFPDISGGSGSLPDTLDRAATDIPDTDRKDYDSAAFTSYTGHKANDSAAGTSDEDLEGYDSMTDIADAGRVVTDPATDTFGVTGVKTEDAETVGTEAAAQEAANDATSNVLQESVKTEKLSSGYVPELDSIEFGSVLNKRTDFYYFHPEESREVPANSAEVTEWKKVKNGLFGSTKLKSIDLVKMYLSYTIPAGALNETNQIVRYRLPANIHMTDDQIIAINATENGMSALYADAASKKDGNDVDNVYNANDAGDRDNSEDANGAADPDDEAETEAGPDTTNPTQDENAANYQKYLGVEAIEGTRTPDEKLKEGKQEYISAIVKAENVFDEEGLYGEKGAFLGQDLIFIFTPYSIEKNQTIYNADGDPLSAGEKITGWFACDFNMSQIDWIEEDTDLDNSTVEKTAEVVFIEKDNEHNVKEISRKLKLVDVTKEQSDVANGGETAAAAETASENAAIDETALASTGNTSEQANPDDPAATSTAAATSTDEAAEVAEDGLFKSGTLTADGDGYKITLDYTEEARIPENAELSVREITAETDREAYEACLEQAGQQVASDDKTSVDKKASRFFDIEILLKDTEDNDQGKARKIEPAAPVTVNIQIINDSAIESTESGDEESDRNDPAVLHFAEEGVEQIDSTVKTSREHNDDENRSRSKEPDPATEISFEAESFSVYGVVYTVDFHWEVDGKEYEFSIPGGGYISFYELVKVLGIEKDDAETEKDEIRELTDGIEKIEFSDPALVSISRAEEDTNVGAIKDLLRLECEYSAELTNEEIKEINSQEVKAGDWVLISLKAFDTEEYLTITMKNGEIWTVKVTDVQGSISSSVETGEYMIVYQDGSNFYALANGGGTVPVTYNASTEKVIYTGTENLVWNISDNDGEWTNHYLITETSRPDYYIALENNTSNILRQYWGWVYIRKPILGSGNEFILQGETFGRGQYLSFDSTNRKFVPTPLLSGPFGAFSRLYLVKVEETPKQYTFTVQVDDAAHGTVSGTNAEGQSTGDVTSFELVTGDVNSEGIGQYNALNRPITAKEKEGYVFDHWEYNGMPFSSEKVLDGTLYISGENAVVKAVYKKDTTIHDDLTEEEIEERLDVWASNMMSDTVTTTKTAQVHDYANRIYEISLGAASGVRRVMPMLDLAFITDVSRSMYFPATLKQETTFTQNKGNNSSDLYNWLNDSNHPERKNNVYYVVTSDSSATVSAVYYGGKLKNNADTDYASEWRSVDASFFNPEDAESMTDSEKPYLKGKKIGKTGSACYYGNALTGKLYTAVGTLKRMDYLKMAAKAASNVLYGVDPDSRVGLVTFAANAFPENTKFYANPGTSDNAFYDALTKVSLKGGTDQADGLDEGRKLFSNNPRSGNTTPKRVALLITDGAPNQKGRTSWSDVIKPAADKLKNLYETDPITLFTLGLSMDMVGTDNQDGLKSIATGGVDGGHWFEASNGPGIVAAIKNIIESIINEASLKGNIIDTIDPAFYPVTASGTPLIAGDIIDLEGNLIGKVTANGGKVDLQGRAFNGEPNDGKYGVITKSGSSFTVTWSNQVIGYKTDGTSAWNGKFYVKAKEDFLGGNSINTNVGESDKFIPAKYVIDGSEYNLYQGDEAKLGREFLSPHVNVNELTLTQNSTEWTVCLGTKVNPEEQMQALADNIRVKEVVQSSTNYMITDKNAMLGSSNTDESETFPLNHAVDLQSLSKEEWASLASGNVLTKPYTAYNHTTGTMVISLMKIGDAADFEEHVTTQTGEGVERYVFSAIFTPNPPSKTDEEYRTTPGGTPGAETEKMTSTNTHKINVFAKRLKITKVDQENNDIKNSPAVFKLFRKAKQNETPLNAKDVPSCLPTGSYVLVETLRTNSDGVVTTISSLGKLPNDEPYYLVETTAPDGYNVLKGYLEVRVTTDSINSATGEKTPQDVWSKVLDQTNPRESNTKWNPYVLSNWVQNATIVIKEDGELEGYAVRDGNITYNHNEESGMGTVHYKIRNDAGVELPSTGGPGITLTYLLGIMLVGLAGAGLLMSRRRRAA